MVCVAIANGGGVPSLGPSINCLWQGPRSCIAHVLEDTCCRRSTYLKYGNTHTEMLNTGHPTSLTPKEERLAKVFWLRLHEGK